MSSPGSRSRRNVSRAEEIPARRSNPSGSAATTACWPWPNWASSRTSRSAARRSPQGSGGLRQRPLAEKHPLAESGPHRGDRRGVEIPRRGDGAAIPQRHAHAPSATAGLVHLRGLKSLAHLAVNGTALTLDGIAGLKPHLPRLGNVYRPPGKPAAKGRPVAKSRRPLAPWLSSGSRTARRWRACSYGSPMASIP